MDGLSISTFHHTKLEEFMNWDRMKVRDKEGEKSSAMQTSGHDIIVACVNSQKLCYTHKTAKKKNSSQ